MTLLHYVLAAASVASVTLVGNAPANADENSSPYALTVGVTHQSLSDYCCETPTALPGLDVGLDRAVGRFFGVRGRFSVVRDVSTTDTQGIAPRLELGGFARWSPASRFTLEASALAGIEYADMSDRGDAPRAEVGPVAAAEAAVIIDVTPTISVSVGGGFRASWSVNDDGEVARGPVARVGLSWRF